MKALDKSLRLYLPVSMVAFDKYGASLAMALPTLQQRGEVAAIAHWRTDEEGAMTAGDLLRLLHCLAGSSNDPAQRDTVIAAQHNIWERLQVLANGYTPPLPVPHTDSREWGTAQRTQLRLWQEHFFSLLGKFEQQEGFDASGIRRQLPPRVAETLTRQTARALMDTPYLLGHTLYKNAGRFTNGAFPAHKLAMVLAAATRNAWHDAQDASERHLASLAFWGDTLKGFMYGAAHSDRNTLAAVADIGDQDLLRDALVYVPTDSAWKHWTRGDAADLNRRIANASVQQLWDKFQAQPETV